MNHTIDAKGKTLGRVASEAARLLIGKDTASFVKNKVTGSKVHLSNVSLAKFDEKKLGIKNYARYSGYPGGLRKDSMKDIVTRKGYSEIFRKAVYGMLPPNKLRSIRMKNLTISE